MIIVDTNVLSELMRAVPSASVLRWVAEQPPVSLFTTVLCEGEIRAGVAYLPPGKRRDDLTKLADIVFNGFEDRVLPFTRAAAREWVEVRTIRRAHGAPISVVDGQIVAIARSLSAVVATRNVDDFTHCDVRVINPWE